MKVKNIFQHDSPLFGRWILQVHPREEVRIRQQCRHQEEIDISRVEPSLRGEGVRSDHASESFATAVMSRIELNLRSECVQGKVGKTLVYSSTSSACLRCDRLTI